MVIFNIESTVNSKYFCLCKVFFCLFVLKGRLVWSLSLLSSLGWHTCKDEGIFPLRTASHTACPSLRVMCSGRLFQNCAAWIAEVQVLHRPCDRSSDVVRQGQVLWQYCLLLTEATQSTPQPGCQRACQCLPVCDGVSEGCSHWCLWLLDYLLTSEAHNRGQTKHSQTEYVMIAYTILRNPFVLLRVGRGFPALKLQGKYSNTSGTATNIFKRAPIRRLKKKRLAGFQFDRGILFLTLWCSFLCFTSDTKKRCRKQSNPHHFLYFLKLSKKVNVFTSLKAALTVLKNTVWCLG